jgi:hypothetical protein
VLLVLQRVLDGQNAAPGVAVQVEVVPIEAERLPMRLVQTRKVPFGVLIGIIFTPPVSTSSRAE